MGTFHHDRSPLHGITVLVETTAGEAWVGRCDDEDGERVILHDAEVHPGEPPSALARGPWLARVLQVGQYPRHRRVIIPRPLVATLTRLSEVSGS